MTKVNIYFRGYSDTVNRAIRDIQVIARERELNIDDITTSKKEVEVIQQYANGYGGSNVGYNGISVECEIKTLSDIDIVEAFTDELEDCFSEMDLQEYCVGID